MKERLAVIDGIRTPFVKAGTVLKEVSADHLGTLAVQELIQRLPINKNQIDEVVVGNVSQPANAANIARVIALKAGIHWSVPAMTVHRNCASGMEAISTAASKIFSGESEIILAGGTESMSNIPLLFNRKMTTFFDQLSRAKTLKNRLQVLASFRLPFLKPVVGILEGLTDPVSGLIMGMTAENLVRDFTISRADQDQFALESHHRAAKAESRGFFNQERFVMPQGPTYETMISTDTSVRQDQSIEALQKLRPYFDRKNGTVTVGNACPLTDGAAAMLVMSESKAKSLGLTPLGYVRDYAYAGLDPSRMGLGPVYAAKRVFEKTGLSLSEMSLVEINEAFSAQVLACVKAFADDAYCQKHINVSALGEINMNQLNVNGGAIAIGHPVGTTGIRLVLTLLHALKEKGKHRGLASLCIGGGQGGAFIVETE